MPLSKEYVKQLNDQINLKFALTLKFMNEDPFYVTILDKTAKMKPETIEKLPDADREELKKIVCDVIEDAIKRADDLAKKLAPITAPMEDASP